MAAAAAAVAAGAYGEVAQTMGDILYMNAINSRKAGRDAETRNDFEAAASYYFFAEAQFAASAVEYDRELNTASDITSRRMRIGVLRDSVRVYTRISRLQDGKELRARTRIEKLREEVTSTLWGQSIADVARLTADGLRQFTRNMGSAEAYTLIASITNYTQEMAAYTTLVEQATVARAVLRIAQDKRLAAEAQAVMAPPPPAASTA